MQWPDMEKAAGGMAAFSLGLLRAGQAAA